jgi:hypothetical protein
MFIIVSSAFLAPDLGERSQNADNWMKRKNAIKFAPFPPF